MSHLQTTFAVSRLVKLAQEENVYGVLAALDLLGVIKLDLLPLGTSPAGRAKKVLSKMAGSEPIQTLLQEQDSVAGISEGIGSLTPVLPDWLEGLEAVGVDKLALEQLWLSEDKQGELYRLRLRRNHKVFTLLCRTGRVKDPTGFLKACVLKGWTLSSRYQPGYKQKQQELGVLKAQQQAEQARAQKQAELPSDTEHATVLERMSAYTQVLKARRGRFGKGVCETGGVGIGTAPLTT